MIIWCVGIEIGGGGGNGGGLRKIIFEYFCIIFHWVDIDIVYMLTMLILIYWCSSLLVPTIPVAPASIVGVDISKEMIDYANKTYRCR